MGCGPPRVGSGAVRQGFVALDHFDEHLGALLLGSPDRGSLRKSQVSVTQAGCSVALPERSLPCHVVLKGTSRVPWCHLGPGPGPPTPHRPETLPLKPQGACLSRLDTEGRSPGPGQPWVRPPSPAFVVGLLCQLVVRCLCCRCLLAQVELNSSWVGGRRDERSRGRQPRQRTEC